MPPKKAPASKPAAKKTTTTGKPKPTTTTGKTKASGTTSAAADKKTAEPEKDTAAATVKAPVLTINIKQVDTVLQDESGTIKSSGKWPLVIDPTEKASTFLRYRDANYLNILNPGDMEPERIRKALIGAMRFGKPVVMDMMDKPIMYDTMEMKMEDVSPGLLTSVMDKTILKEDVYKELIKDSDGPEYKLYMFDEELKGFTFILITSDASPPQELQDKFYNIIVEG